MLINSIIQIREYVPISAMTEYETVKPAIAAAERQYIKPVLGKELYDELAELDDTASDKQKELLDLVRSSLANLTMFKGFDTMNVMFDESGFKRSSENSSLYRYQEENLKNGFKEEGFNGIDFVLEYLQANLSDFDNFKSSDFYQEMKGSFFPTTRDFNNIYGINNSRLVFLQISRFFNRVLDFEIIPVLGQELYSKLIEEMKKEADQNPNADLLALVPYVQKPLAFLSIHSAINEIGMQMTDKGFYFETQASGGDSNINTDIITGEQAAVIGHNALVNGERYKNGLLEYLKANAEIYADFVQTELNTVNPYQRDNTGKRTFFA